MEKLTADLLAIRKKAPLVHSITNFVVMEFTANMLLSIGASPIMAHALEEVEEMTLQSNALYLNIGTPNSEWSEAMIRSLRVAKMNQIPVVLDPVGVGATAYRKKIALALLDSGGVCVIRGNASEIVSLLGNDASSKGVDTLLKTTDYIEEAKMLAKARSCTILMSGEVDVVTDGDQVKFFTGGSPLMKKVTGMGCSLSALVATFLASITSPFESACQASLLMKTCGEIASKKNLGPQSFKAELMDELYRISHEKSIF